MQAYATVERLTPGGRSSLSGSTSDTGSLSIAPETAVIDQLLGRLADLVVDRLMKRTEASPGTPDVDWMDARTAALYLGIHRDTLRKLAAERAVPVHQDDLAASCISAVTSSTAGVDPGGRQGAT